MSLTQGNDPGWTSFSDYEMTTNLVAMSLTSHSYTVEVTADVQKPWMHYANNGPK